VVVVGSGGARNRSGPQPVLGSGRSDRRGVSLSALPSSYDGPVPEFPLGDASDSELGLWAEAWTWPQANAWAAPSEAWRQRTVALWVRLRVQCEVRDAPAALLSQLHRFADQVGLTTAGLAEMGWRVAADEVAAKAVEREPVVRRERRLRVAGDAQ
jgi:hypothetical protein